MVKCKVEGCENPSRASGYCTKHYKQLIRKGTVSDLKTHTGCLVEGCGSTHHAKGFCKKHYNWYSRGIITKEGKAIRKVRKYLRSTLTGKIPDI